MDSDTNDGQTVENRGRLADAPGDITWAGWKDVAARVRQEVKADHVVLSASGVAFHAFLALVPLLVAVVSIYGLVADPSSVIELVDRFSASIPEQLAELIEQQLTSVVNSGSGSLGIGAAVGVAAALWSASSGVSHLMEAINIAYDEDVDERPFWKKRSVAIALTLLVVGFIATISFIMALAARVDGAVGVLSFVAGIAVVITMLMGVLATIYRYAPDRNESEWSWVTVGSIIAVVGWFVASAGFTLYVSRFGSYNETYGSLGAIVVVLLWMFITALVVLVGAEVNAELEHQTMRDTTVGGDQPIGERGAEMADTVGRSA